jgi:hypothetical protein
MKVSLFRGGYTTRHFPGLSISNARPSSHEHPYLPTFRYDAPCVDDSCPRPGCADHPEHHVFEFPNKPAYPTSKRTEAGRLYSELHFMESPFNTPTRPKADRFIDKNTLTNHSGQKIPIYIESNGAFSAPLRITET